MARAGLGKEWNCQFANDFDSKKASSYIANWGDEHFTECDIRDLSAKNLPSKPSLLWASFPCQDLSLAGSGLGLMGERSSTVQHIWRLIRELKIDDRAPDVITFENVCGLLTSRGGRDFAKIVQDFDKHGYDVGAVVIDAVLFVPQSRKRIFFIAVKKGKILPIATLSKVPVDGYAPKNLIRAVEKLPKSYRTKWLWWNLPKVNSTSVTLDEIIQSGKGLEWHSGESTARLLSQMNQAHFDKVEKASKLRRVTYATIYRRTRVENGQRVVRAEARFDGIAGCLRTPNGGSSKQILLEVNGYQVRSRHLSGRECARLMGLPDSYQIPRNHNQALYLAGDGVAVPVVKFLSKSILLPVVKAIESPQIRRTTRVLTAA